MDGVQMLLELSFMICVFALVWGGLMFIIIRRRRGRSAIVEEGGHDPADAAAQADRRREDVVDMMRDAVERPGMSL